jgi:hypothetical protein
MSCGAVERGLVDASKGDGYSPLVASINLPSSISGPLVQPGVEGFFERKAEIALLPPLLSLRHLEQCFFSLAGTSVC